MSFSNTLKELREKTDIHKSVWASCCMYPKIQYRIMNLEKACPI